MIIEFTTKEAANYIRTNNAIKEQFLKDLDPDASLKERTYPIIIPFMPIAFDPTSQQNREVLEDENGWKKDSILTACWIKLVEKRTSTQQVAHILITLTDSMAANMAICDGIMFGQLKLWPKKNQHEPMRYAKCQHYGHIARECISHTDTCTNCGNNHCTSDCTARDKQYCTTCESDEHPSWSQDCPTFQKKCEDTDK
ncbi:hypothetical protein BDR06DRAFT_876822 [Suillus hirtellus]|nr:hypothetical protein BDR06DRAFT_876822 [Suillus hirtellus]